jgi:pimeloyl-ACP methyl ester carboxylesterase
MQEDTTLIELSSVARRVDREGRYSEEAAFRDVDGSKVFTVTHIPDAGARTGVVVCCSILVEHLTNYRHEVLLARSLAAKGIAVQRFHYRGTGHSSGDEEATSLETMVEDTRAAVGFLRERAPVDRVVFLGTRWGAMVAAMAAQGSAESPLVFWEPAVDGARYFRELIRGRLVRELKDASLVAGSADAWKSELEEKGWVDILGYPLRKPMYESGRGQRLDALLVGRVGPVLLVQFGRQNAPRPDYVRLRDQQAARGGVVDIRFIRDEPAWFFPGHRMKSAGELVELTTNWLVQVDGRRPDPR